MMPFQDRVLVEQKELAEKLQRLTAFMRSETYDDLGDEEKDRLVRQLAAMTAYHNVLNERIVAFAS